MRKKKREILRKMMNMCWMMTMMMMMTDNIPTQLRNCSYLSSVSRGSGKLRKYNFTKQATECASYGCVCDDRKGTKEEKEEEEEVLEGGAVQGADVLVVVLQGDSNWRSFPALLTINSGKLDEPHKRTSAQRATAIHANNKP